MAQVVMGTQVYWPVFSVSTGDLLLEKVAYVADVPGETVQLSRIPKGAFIFSYNPDEKSREQAEAEMKAVVVKEEALWKPQC